GSALEDIERKLAEVVQTERQGIERRLAGLAAAAGRLEALDRLPPDPAGRLRELQRYDFVEPEARRLFEALLRSLRQQMLQPLLASMSPAQRGQLETMMQSLLLQDERLDALLRQLAAELAAVAPLDERRRRYEFRGDDRLSLDEAMKLMETLGQMDELERQLRRVQTPEDLARIDPKAVEQALGAEAAQDLERLREL